MRTSSSPSFYSFTLCPLIPTNHCSSQFVVPESTAAKPGVQFQEDEATPNEPERRLSTPVEPKSASPKENLIQQQPEPPALISPSLGDYSATSPHASGSHELQDPSSYTIGISPSNAAYETALDGLLSLGNDHYVPQSASVTSQVTANGGFFESPNHGQHHATPTQFDLRDKPLAEIFPNCLHMPQDRAVELLRHYRYHIAPWVRTSPLLRRKSSHLTSVFIVGYWRHKPDLWPASTAHCDGLGSPSRLTSFSLPDDSRRPC